jgi:hypothetical protein
MSLIATMSALLLGLLIASAATSYDQQNSLRGIVQQTHDRIWSPDGVRPEVLNSAETRDSAKANIEQLHRLSPTTDVERMMLSRAMQQSDSLAQARLLMFEHLGNSIPWPFLLFLGFGLFSSPNPTIIVARLAGALSVACAIFLILEMNDAYRGLMRISDEPLCNAMVQIDQ